jgi:hypothetical protein
MGSHFDTQRPTKLLDPVSQLSDPATDPDREENEDTLIASGTTRAAMTIGSPAEFASTSVRTPPTIRKYPPATLTANSR